jgi:hypothetical protein
MTPMKRLEVLGQHLYYYQFVLQSNVWEPLLSVAIQPGKPAAGIG